MPRNKFVKIEDAYLRHVWSPPEDAVMGRPVVVGPSFYEENGTPTSDEGDYTYSHTEIERTTVTVHVRGGVAYPPDKLPPHVKLRIMDHDNEGRS